MTNEGFFAKHPDLIVREESPFNAGPPLDQLRRAFVTPQELFFVRNHGSVPEVDPMTYRLSVDGIVEKPLSLSLEEIRDGFPKTMLAAVLECAGNRRGELMEIAPMPGEVPWGAEAIGNALWGGTPLREVLRAAGIGAETGQVAFIGLDEVEKEGQRFGFGGSIPVGKAMSPEVLLVYEMNGSPLAHVHGFPLRVVVPGYIGARSVKWLGGITVQDHPSTNYFQTRAYKLFPPQIQAETAEWSGGMMLGELPVNAVICRPREGERMEGGRALAQGYALAGGGRSVERVELSTDEGKTWVTAALGQVESPWAWRFWEVWLELSHGARQIVVRAWDAAANTQPEQARNIWNFKGYVNNAWHKVNVVVGG